MKQCSLSFKQLTPPLSTSNTTGRIKAAEHQVIVLCPCFGRRKSTRGIFVAAVSRLDYAAFLWMEGETDLSLSQIKDPEQSWLDCLICPSLLCLFTHKNSESHSNLPNDGLRWDKHTNKQVDLQSEHFCGLSLFPLQKIIEKKTLCNAAKVTAAGQWVCAAEEWDIFGRLGGQVQCLTAGLYIWSAPVRWWCTYKESCKVF